MTNATTIIKPLYRSEAWIDLCFSGIKKRLGRCSLITTLSYFVTILLLQFNTASAQITPCVNCSAKDVGVDITKVELVQPNPAYVAGNGEPKYISFAQTCTGSQQFVGALKISIDQNATTRYGYRFKGNIYIDGAYVSSFSFCDPSTFSSGQYDLYVESPDITWTCGTKLELKNLFVGWGNSTSDDVCADDACSLEPHCKQFSLEQSFVVVTPLSADFTYSGTCPSGNTAQTYSFDALNSTGGTTGGTPTGTPATYPSFSWSIARSSSPNVEVATMNSVSNPTYNFSTLGAGDYIVTLAVTDDEPVATSTVSHTITVVSCCTNPVITNQTPAAICSGGSVSLSSFTGTNTIPSGTTYSWSAPTTTGISGLGSGTDQSSFSTENLANTTNNPIQVVYTVTPKSGTCTGSSFTVTVTVNPTPGAPTVTAGPFCSSEGKKISDLPSGSGTYKYYAAETGGSALAGTTVLSTGTYWVSTTSGASCESDRSSVSITVNQTPSAPINVTAGPFCSAEGKKISDLPSGSGTYKYYAAETGGSALAGTTVLSTGTYWVSTTSGASCESDRSSVSITVNQTPNAPEVSAGPFCSAEGKKISDLPSGSGTYKYYAAETGGSALAGTTVLSTGTYWVSTTSGTGCESDRSSVSITVNQTPSAPINVTAGPFCSAEGKKISDLPTGSGAYKYYAAESGGSALAGTTVLSTGTYWVSTTSGAGCESGRSSVSITVNQTPNAPSVSAGPFCSAEGKKISDLPSGSGAFKYYAAETGGSALAGTTVLSTGTYWVSTTSGAGCESGRSSVSITVNQTPSAPINVTAGPFCVNEGKKISDLPSGSSTYKYYAAQTGGNALAGTTVIPLGTNTYWVSTTSSTGCESARSSLVVIVNPNSICPAYTGIYFTNTSSTTTGGSASFNLTYTIGSAGCNGASGLLLANFLVSATSDNPTTITYGAKNYNSSTGILTVPVTVALGNSVYSAGVTFTLALQNAPNYAISSSCSVPVLVTVSTKADGFVTGGGYIIPTDAKGSIGLDANGSRTNFGFNIKYNKASTNLQGNWNMIIRTSAGLWQVKSSQPTYLTVSRVGNTTAYKADMVFSAANIKNLTTGTGYGTGTVNVTVYDNGEPGSGVDQIFIKVTDGATTYYTSSSSANLSTPSSIPTLKAGNIQVHTLGAKREAAIVVNSFSDKLDVSAAPNPFTNVVRFTIQSPVSGKGSLDIYNLMGQKLYNVYNGHVTAGAKQMVEFNAPSKNSGSLIYSFKVGGRQVNGKIIQIK